MRKPLSRLIYDAFLFDTWNIGVIDAPVERVLLGDAPPVRWLPETKGYRYLADPFAVQFGGKTYILCEDYGYPEHRAHIALLDLAEAFDGAPPKPAFDIGVHMSYPFTFENQGELFCVPETHEANEANLYRCRGSLDRWEKVTALLPGVAAVDTSLVRHQDVWWLFFTLAHEDGGSTTLHAAYADQLTGPYRLHPQNPVKTDPRSSRPAGPPLAIDGTLYRPAQDCSETYGGAIAVNKVTALSPAVFAEETIRFLRPEQSGRYPHGLHTICAAGDRTIVDGKRTHLHPFAPPVQLLGRLRARQRRNERNSNNRTREL